MDGPHEGAGLRRWLVSLRKKAASHPRLSVATALGVAAVAALSATLAFTLSGSPARAKPVAAAAAPLLPHRPLATPRPVVRHWPLRDPFTGERVRALGPELTVKIDNIVYARPQTGLRSADIVYVIPVEGGLTRFMAVFSSHIPPVIGPVRSARQSDLDLLRQFGRPAFAWSGATPHLVPFIERAPVVDLYALLVGGYYRDQNRVAPYNLYANTKQLLREAPHASKARDIGFRFGSLPAGGRAVGSYSVKYPEASYTFRWSASAKRWLTWIDGAPAAATEGGQLGGSTVVIQYTQISTSRFEEYGGRPPYAKSVGAGRAVILRDGRAYTVHWSRPTLPGGTIYTLPNGQRMLFARGQVWVVLAPDSHASYVNAAAV
jgi:Protein of unknown function (DUF3048) N-terminal domain/Protein of unknown function (DUF3048) C-terminal domain